MFCKWNHAVCNFLGLTFSLSIVLLHSGFCRSEYPIPFYGVVFHCVDIPQLDNCSPGEGHLGCIQIPCYCVVFRCMDISQSYTHSLGEGHLGCIELFTLWIRLLYEFLYQSFCKLEVQFSWLHKYLRVELLGHKVDVYLIEVMPYNSYAILFTHFKVYSSLFSSISHNYATITTVSFRTSSFPWRETCTH